jgi:hypothetical protein
MLIEKKLFVNNSNFSTALFFGAGRQENVATEKTGSLSAWADGLGTGRIC